MLNAPDAVLLSADGGNAHHLLDSRSDIDGRRHVPGGYIAAFLDSHVAWRNSAAPVQLQP